MRVPLRPRDLIVVALVSVFALAASGTHVVRSGETLSDIAIANDTTVRAIVAANGIADPDIILVGQSLKLPGGGAAASSSGKTYVVRAGDTLGGIAVRFGTTVRKLAEANGISNPNLVVVGRTLTITGGGSGGGSTGGGSGPQLAGQRHTVKPGETIAGIARRYGISASDFARWNGLVDGKLYASARLVLYDPGSLPGTAPTGTAPQKHTVRNGETLSGIASKYGSSSRAIAEASGLSSIHTIYVGQTLKIPGSSGTSGVRCPVAGATFMNDWGFPRSGGRAHAGTDMFAPRGTPIVAPVSGWVDIATGTIGGHQFRLTTGDGTLWFGSHMAKFGKSGKVSAGDVIGYVGDSGNARGGRPHLHFEVHPKGTNAVNPYPLVRSVC